MPRSTALFLASFAAGCVTTTPVVDGSTRADAAPASCGDGVRARDEECDDGAANAESGACLPTCMAARCGDGLLHEGAEACDDGNTASDDACPSDCAVCGDGVVQGSERCEGSACSGDCRRQAGDAEWSTRIDGEVVALAASDARVFAILNAATLETAVWLRALDAGSGVVRASQTRGTQEGRFGGQRRQIEVLPSGGFVTYMDTQPGASHCFLRSHDDDGVLLWEREPVVDATTHEHGEGLAVDGGVVYANVYQRAPSSDVLRMHELRYEVDGTLVGSEASSLWVDVVARDAAFWRLVWEPDRDFLHAEMSSPLGAWSVPIERTGQAWRIAVTSEGLVGVSGSWVPTGSAVRTDWLTLLDATGTVVDTVSVTAPVADPGSLAEVCAAGAHLFATAPSVPGALMHVGPGAEYDVIELDRTPTHIACAPGGGVFASFVEGSTSYVSKLWSPAI